MAKQHFTHPNHLLFEYSNDQVYICKACNTLGTGRRYRCHDCDFDLHEFCANCHTKLSSPQLHEHELQLSTRNDMQTVSCAVCQNSIKGLIFYHCSCSQQCNFNVHPLCTQLKSQSQSGSSSSTVPPLTPSPSSSSQGGMPPPVRTSRRKRFLKKTAVVISTVTLGVVSSIIYDMLGIEKELKGQDKS